MAAPPKPWELNNVGVENRILQSSSIPSNPQFTNTPLMPSGGRNINSQTVPSRPPRPNNNSYMNNPTGYGGAYGSSYSPYGYNSMSMYGRPSYGMGGMGYGGYGSSYGSMGYGGSSYAQGYGGMYPNDTESRFVQYAEESSRSTFQNVENIVRAFSSISMMLDNTFFAMTSSFRAVLSVTENFGRLRSMFGHIWTSVNIFRLVNWLYRKLMSALGLKVGNPKKAWTEALEPNGTTPDAPVGSSWPVVAFLSVIISAPYLISKFLPSNNEDKRDPKHWTSPGITTKAAYDFLAAKEDELSVRANETVTVAPQYIQDEMNLNRSGWCYVVTNQGAGIVPYNYLQAPRFNNPQAPTSSATAYLSADPFK